jgi:hydroxymethylglutaryl-CoA lyase
MNGTHKKVEITDVTTRDGFQMEKNWIPTKEKIGFINRMINAGVKRIEATSFVSPKAVPQLKDAKEVIEGIQKKEETIIAALVPNLKGTELAITCPIDEINVVISISELHNLKNVKRTVKESMKEIIEISRLVKQEGKRVNVGLATTFGCPFEGITPLEKIADVIGNLESYSISSFALSDTTGMANPKQIYNYVNQLQRMFPTQEFTLHLHNTRGMGLANILAGHQAGITKFDASTGGIGGCPFAPGATGNVCTEDVVHMFEQMDIDTGIDLDQLISASNDLEALLGYTLPGQVMKAGKTTDLYEYSEGRE